MKKQKKPLNLSNNQQIALSDKFSKDDFKILKNNLAEYKSLIDKELKIVSSQMLTDTFEQFGEHPYTVMAAFNDVLSRGGKRIRGALAINTYKMFGGKDMALILRAASALEMLNTYMLVADDIQDRSPSRRGGPTVHTELMQMHKQLHYKGDSSHFGVASAISSFLVAQHYAANIIAELPTTAEVRISALKNLNRCYLVTGHGQTLDIFSEYAANVTKNDINNILIWKTAYYTFINPMQLGAILAGADDKSIESLIDYGREAGRTFQLTDDILGTFGSENLTGKSPLDDIKEGKRTLLIEYTLDMANKTDQYFLLDCLGNQDLSAAEFLRCQNIIMESGALAATQQEAAQSANNASSALSEHKNWPKPEKQFLTDLVNYLLVRSS